MSMTIVHIIHKKKHNITSPNQDNRYIKNISRQKSRHIDIMSIVRQVNGVFGW
jgi:hypothetical protein